MASEQISSNFGSSKKIRYLLILGVLVIAFSVSFMIRAEPAMLGFELNEFDPFFNYRATEFIVENGIPAYLEWHDDMTWYPFGRNVSATSQVMLHVTASTLYQVFGAGSSLYDFTILFPAVIGSLTTIIVFALVRTISSTSAGLLASLFFAVSLPVVLRGSIGWFKSEPLGLFYGLLAVYLLLSGIKSDKGWISLTKIVGSGILLALGLASWGGIQFFIIPIGIFFLALPFLRKDNKFIMWASIVFVSTFVLVTISFEKTSIAFISSLSGFFLIGCTVFLVAASLIKKIGNRAQIRNGLALLGGAIIIGLVIISSGIINFPAFRYLNAANPFLIAERMLTDSVSEHASTSTEFSFLFFSILIVFAGIGAWLIFQNRVNRSFKIKSDMAAFALILGLLGAYFSSSFIRLEVLGAISLIVLASIGASILISKILKEHSPARAVTKISFLGIIVILLTIPMVYPEDLNWASYMLGTAPTIVNGGTHFLTATNDWTDAMQWLRENTPKDSVVAAWWDYGYWISTLGERKSLSDNATLMDWQIKKTASMLFSTPENAWKILTSDTREEISSNFVSFPMTNTLANNLEERKLELFTEWQIGDANRNGISNAEEVDIWWAPDTICAPITTDWSCAKYKLNPGKVDQYPTVFDYWESEVYELDPALTGLDADYVLIQLAGLKLPQQHNEILYYFGDKGGDMSKAYWIMKIAGLPLGDYYNPDGKSFNDKFWNETLFGKLIPFTPLVYINVETGDQSMTWTADTKTAIYAKDIKFPSWNTSAGIKKSEPFHLVYVSPSVSEPIDDNMIVGVIIYEVNHDYQPKYDLYGPTNP